jgi:hypothetical protein
LSRTLLRRVPLSGLLTLVLAAGAFTLALDRPAPRRAPAFTLAAADGALQLANDRAGAAILGARDLRPGDRAEGSVRLSVAAGFDVSLHLRLDGVTERPGAGGGRLATRLALQITDVTSPSRPVTVYDGPPAGLSSVSLGTLQGGIERRYRFAVAFPSGPDDDAYQGAALSAGFLWTATETVAAAPTPTPAPSQPSPAAPPAAPQPTPAVPDPAPAVPDPAPPETSPAPVAEPPAATLSPSTTAAAARIVGLPAARSCVVRRRYVVSARAAAGVTLKSVRVYVDNRRARGGRRSKATLNLLKTRRSRVAVRVVVATSAGTVRAARSYRLCRPR